MTEPTEAEVIAAAKAIADIIKDDRVYCGDYARAALTAAAQVRERAEAEQYNISQTIDGEWRTPPLEYFYRACCDCGLVHKEEYRIQDGRVQYRVTRDREETRLERARTGKGGKIVQGLREAVAGDLAIMTIEGQVWERRPGTARHTPDLMPIYGTTEPDQGPDVLGLRKDD